jgi:hypothetical protein
LSSKWQQEIHTWFDEYDVEEAHNFADGLYDAMCSDASIREQ